MRNGITNKDLAKINRKMEKRWCNLIPDFQGFLRTDLSEKELEELDEVLSKVKI